MSNYYNEVYHLRLNRYGLDFQSRIQNQREKDFDNYLLKTIYRVDFEHDGKNHSGSLERYKQNHTETQGYLLTKRDLSLPNGTMLNIISHNGDRARWMVWWKEAIEASGYNKYIVLKASHLITWTAPEGDFEQWAYFYGPGTSKIEDVAKTSTDKPVYLENNNQHMFITSYNKLLEKDQYFEVTFENRRQGFVITGYDFHSTPGVAYITVDPVQLREKPKRLKPIEGAGAEDYFWFAGGNNA